MIEREFPTHFSADHIEVVIKSTPSAIGMYWLGPDFGIALTRKPSWWNRFWVRVALGWQWGDAPVEPRRLAERARRAQRPWWRRMWGMG